MKLILQLGTLLVLLFAGSAHAQIPQLINYQGRVAVGTTNFDGSGQFKFALVNGTGSTTYWSNDGTSTAGSQPTAAVALTVTKGLYSVLLGDTTLSNMTAVPASVFSNADVRLRVWFNDGTNGSQLLTPDQRIAAVGYAMVAGSVPNGAITSGMIASGAITNDKVASSSISTDKFASGASAFSTTANNATLLSQGYVQTQSTGLTDLMTTGTAWQATSSVSPPTARQQQHTAIWTGSEMIVWGGRDASIWYNSGGRYNPTTDSWAAVTTTNAPSGRAAHTAIWTGSEMIIWGGSTGLSSTYFNTGARYNPNTDIWTTMSTTNAPVARHDHVAVWTGTEMLVWSGYDGGYRNDGARYNPSNDTWTPMTLTNTPASRAGGVCAVWTGTEMVVFGGGNGSSNVNTGGRYNPVTDIWVATSTTNAPLGRGINNGAVWTGTEMIAWAGTTTGGTKVNTGGRYNPTTNTWTTMSVTNAPVARDFHALVWTGTELMVFAGSPDNGTNQGGTPINSGGRYNPTTNTWLAISTLSLPGARRYSRAVWSGSEMIVWGGNDGTSNLNTGGRNNPSNGPNQIYLYVKP